MATLVSSPCDACGLAARQAHGVIRQVRTAWPRAGARPRVYVVTGWLADQDLLSPDIAESPRVIAFRQALLHLGWSEEELDQTFAFGPAVRCPLLKGVRTHGPEARACVAYSRADVDWARPELVVFLGWKVWQLFGRQRQERDVLGRVLPAEGVGIEVDGVSVWEPPVLTVTDPLVVFDHPDRHCVAYHLADLEQIRLWLDGRYVSDPFRGKDYRLVTNGDDAAAAIRSAASAGGLVGFDIETGNAPHALDFYSRRFKVLGISLSWADRQGVFVPLRHRELAFAEVPSVQQELRALAESGAALVAHNGVAFDAPALRLREGLSLRVAHDTMLADALEDENRVHTLKAITAATLPDLRHYEDKLDAAFPAGVKRADRDFELHVPLDVLWRYACADADATRRTATRQRELLATLPSCGLFATQRDYFDRHVMLDAEATAAMSERGVPLDRARVRAHLEDAEARLEELRRTLLSDPVVAELERRREAALITAGRTYYDGERYLYRSRAARAAGEGPIYDAAERRELWPGVGAGLQLRKNGAVLLKGTYSDPDVEFNLGSDDQVRKLLGDLLERSPVQARTKLGKPSVQRKVLVGFAVDYPWVQSFLDHKSLSKLLSTYLRRADSWVRDDGLVHCEFMLAGSDRGGGTKDEEGGGTVTGRHSARHPNLTNVAKHSKDGKRLHSAFISRFADPRYPFAVDADHAEALWAVMPPSVRSLVRHFVFPGHPGGGAILQADYGQLELRIFAILARCRWMLERYAADADLHSDLAQMVFRVTLEEIAAEGAYYRPAAKRNWFGPIYGQGDGGTWEQMVLLGAKSRHDPTRPITLEEVTEIRQIMEKWIPELRTYKIERERELEENGGVFVASGRFRHLPHAYSRLDAVRAQALRQAGNTPIQGLGGDFCNWSGYVLDGVLQQRGLRSLRWNSVHDCHVLDCPSEEVPQVSTLTREVMADIPFPGFTKQESPVRWVVDVEAGPSWGEMRKISA